MITGQLRVADIPVTPWRNGGGTTQELVSWPPGDSRFDWRVSIATIASDGPFSAFPGVDRTLTLIGGDGIRLHGPDLDLLVDTLHAPVDFAGDLWLDCTLIGDRPCTALNVMSRRGHGRAEIEIVTGPWASPGISHGLLLGLTGHWQVDSRRLTAGSGWWWAGPRREWRLQPGTPADRIAVISWEPE